MCKKNSILLLCISLFIISCKKNNSIKTIDSNLNQENLNKNKIEIEERPRTFDRELDWYIGEYDCIQTSIVSLEDRPIQYEADFNFLGHLKIFKQDSEYKASIYFKTDYGEESYDGKLMLKASFYDSEKVVPALEFYDDKGNVILGYSRLGIGFNNVENDLWKDEVIFIYNNYEGGQDYQRHEYTAGTTVNDNGVRLRSQRNLNCDIITTLNKGQSVRPYAKSDVKFEIDGEQWYWYKIVTEDRKIGWVYGKYLDIAQ